MSAAATSPHTAITIVEPGADQADIDTWYEIVKTTRLADVPDLPTPCRYQLGVAWTLTQPGWKVHRFLAYLGDVPVGQLNLDLPTLDNLENCEIEMSVLPQYRRRGVGRALFDAAMQRAKADGRKRFSTATVESLPDGPVRDDAGTRFATAMGMKPALSEIRRCLDLSTVEPDRYDRLLAEAWPHAAGYSVVSWTNNTPEDCLADVAALDSSFLGEAPLGDLEWEPEKVDADRVRKQDETTAKYGRRRYATALRHDASGRLVALTALVFMHSHPDHAWQGITLVNPAHRGHRLGVISKILNLRHALAHEPKLRTVTTWNANVNQHMIAINEAIGFRAVDAWTDWQRDVEI